MTTRRASCSCGQLALDAEGEPVRMSMCHCLCCQKRTGSAFGVQARFAKERIVMRGRASQYSRLGDDGGRATQQFCPDCGATVCWELDSIPGFVSVAVGAFADPTFPAPTVSVYNARRHPWTRMPELVVENED